MLIETRKEKREFLLKFLLELGFHGYVLEENKMSKKEDIRELEKRIARIEENQTAFIKHVTVIMSNLTEPVLRVDN